MSMFDDDAYAWDDEQPEDTMVERYRNWPIFEDVGGKLYVTIGDEETYCTDIKDAHKEIDKGIKKWNKERFARK